jgi:hypothetical protein
MVKRKTNPYKELNNWVIGEKNPKKVKKMRMSFRSRSD